MEFLVVVSAQSIRELYLGELDGLVVRVGIEEQPLDRVEPVSTLEACLD